MLSAGLSYNLLPLTQCNSDITALRMLPIPNSTCASVFVGTDCGFITRMQFVRPSPDDHSLFSLEQVVACNIITFHSPLSDGAPITHIEPVPGRPDLLLINCAGALCLYDRELLSFRAALSWSGDEPASSTDPKSNLPVPLSEFQSNPDRLRLPADDPLLCLKCAAVILPDRTSSIHFDTTDRSQVWVALAGKGVIALSLTDGRVGEMCPPSTHTTPSFIRNLGPASGLLFCVSEHGNHRSAHTNPNQYHKGGVGLIHHSGEIFNLNAEPKFHSTDSGLRAIGIHQVVSADHLDDHHGSCTNVQLLLLQSRRLHIYRGSIDTAAVDGRPALDWTSLTRSSMTLVKVLSFGEPSSTQLLCDDGQIASPWENHSDGTGTPLLFTTGSEIFLLQPIVAELMAADQAWLKQVNASVPLVKGQSADALMNAALLAKHELVRSHLGRILTMIRHPFGASVIKFVQWFCERFALPHHSVISAVGALSFATPTQSPALSSLQSKHSPPTIALSKGPLSPAESTSFDAKAMYQHAVQTARSFIDHLREFILGAWPSLQALPVLGKPATGKGKNKREDENSDIRVVSVINECLQEVVFPCINSVLAPLTRRACVDDQAVTMRDCIRLAERPLGGFGCDFAFLYSDPPSSSAKSAPVPPSPTHHRRSSALTNVPFQEAIIAVRQLGRPSSPSSKLAALCAVYNSINSTAERMVGAWRAYHQQNNTAQDASISTLPPSNFSLAADDLIAVLAFVLVRAQSTDLCAELQYMTDLADRELMLGSEGYMLTSTQVALQHIHHLAANASNVFVDHEMPEDDQFDVDVPMASAPVADIQASSPETDSFVTASFEIPIRTRRSRSIFDGSTSLLRAKHDPFSDPFGSPPPSVSNDSRPALPSLPALPSAQRVLVPLQVDDDSVPLPIPPPLSAPSRGRSASVASVVFPKSNAGTFHPLQ